MLKTQVFNKATIALALLLGGALAAGAQEKKPATTPTTSATVPSVNNSTIPNSKPGPKPYKDVITDKAITRKGLFTVHKLDDKWFLEIPDSLLGRDVLNCKQNFEVSRRHTRWFPGLRRR